MAIHELSRREARRIAVRAQLLVRARPSGLLDVVRHLTFLQIDWTAAVAPSADLVLWSRLGSAYQPVELARALDERMLFEFDYAVEMYKPAAKRRWGYYALPILYGDRLVGKLDATADRKVGVLRVDAIHEDVPFTKAMTAAVTAEIRDLARWLGLPLDLPAEAV